MVMELSENINSTPITVRETVPDPFTNCHTSICSSPRSGSDINPLSLLISL
jgi:hypothetical protein